MDKLSFDLKHIIWVLLLLSLSRPAGCQVHLYLHCADCTLRPHQKKPDSLAVRQYLHRWRYRRIRQGHLLASVDSIRWAGDTVVAWLYRGPKISMAHLQLDSVPMPLRAQRHRGQRFSPAQLGDFLEALLEKALRAGYPLASVYLADARIRGDSLRARPVVRTGPIVRYAPLDLGDNAPVSRRFLANYLHIRPGDVFDIRHIRQIHHRLHTLDFVTSPDSVQMQIAGAQALVRLRLQRKRANQFNFLIGVLPDPRPGHAVQLVGNIFLDLKNILRNGERLYLKFDRTGPRTQRLDIRVRYPYLLGLPLVPDGQFALYKQDTSFLNLSAEVAASIPAGRQVGWRFFIHQDQSILLGINRALLTATRQLPANLDYISRLLGLEFQWTHLDYAPAPMRGGRLRIKSGAGTHRYQRNPRILELTIPQEPDFSFARLYDSLENNKWKWQTEADLSWFIPLFPNQVISLRSRNGYVGTASLPAYNELYRIGGHDLMRGFSEESLVADFYSVTSAEYRLHFDRYAFLFIFGDYGRISRPDPARTRRDGLNLYGIGAGLNIRSKNSVLSISYALGKEAGHRFDPRAAKIHLGYRSIF